MLAHRIRQRPRRPQKHARVPVVVASVHELLSLVLVGFFYKAPDVERGVVPGVIGGLDVAVAGFGARRINAQHHDVVARGGHGDGLLQRSQEARLVGNYVVGGKNSKHRVGILPLDQEGSQSAGGRGVTGHRLLDDLPGRNALQLAGDLLGQVLVGDNPGLVQTGQRLEPFHGLLQHGTFAIQRQNLLGVGAAGAGPEARTAASSKNHGTEIHWFRHRNHILPDKRYVCTERNESF